MPTIPSASARKPRGLGLRLAAMIAGVGLLTGVAVGSFGYVKARDGLTAATVERLARVNDEGAEKALEGLERARRDLIEQAKKEVIPVVQDALIPAFWNEAHTQEQLRFFYQDPEGFKKRMGTGTRWNSPYVWRHDRAHETFNQVGQLSGYADILIVDDKATVVYSWRKGDDFAAPASGDTGLGQVVKALAAAGDGDVAFSDFAPYAVDGGRPAAFLGLRIAPPTDAEGKQRPPITLVYRLGARYFASDAKAGDAVRTYVTGADGTLKSSFGPGGARFGAPVRNPAVEAALKGETGSTTVRGEDGAARLASYRPVDFAGRRWALVSEQDEAAALAVVHSTGQAMIQMTAIASALAVAAGILFARGLTRPLHRLAGALGGMAQGELDAKIAESRRRDEIGAIARAAEAIRDRARADAAEREAQTSEDLHRRGAERSAMMRSLANDFEAAVGATVATLGREVAALKSAAGGMAELAETARDGTERVAGAAGQANVSVESVAVSAQQLSGSIEEIARLIARSASTTEEANRHAAETGGVVLSLNECAGRIGEVVTLISGIAAQTNLLALNATIEAARAGEAGRGFAVVASEVKTLANQTAKATEEIGRQIEEMRGATSRAVDAISLIQTKVGDITVAMTSAAAAVEEQAAASQTIAGSADEARLGTLSVSTDAGRMRGIVGRTDEAASQVVQAASELDHQTSALDGSVRRFLEHVRAA